MKQKFNTATILFNLCYLAYCCDIEHKVNSSDETCQIIANKYKIDVKNIQINNLNINCNKLAVNEIICIKKNARSKLPDYALCAQYHVVDYAEGCFAIRLKYRLSLPLFLLLNPHINFTWKSPGVEYCPIFTGDEICVSDGNYGCVIDYVLNSTDSCSSVAAAYYLDLESFQFNNPDIDCNDNITKKSVCVIFRNPICTEIYTAKSNDTIETISSIYHVSRKALYLLNPSM